MIRTYIVCLLCLMSCGGAFAALPYQVRFHNEGSDTIRINEILSSVASQRLRTPGQRVVAAATPLLGTPYVAHTLEGEPEILTVNIDQLDCTTFVETAMAMAMTVGERRTSWRDFLFNLQRLRYRGGKIDGYPSRLHYIADWAVDNSYRGNIKDVTSTFPTVAYVTKTLDFMSENASRYPALADSANLARIKDVEQGYRMHRIPYIKSLNLAKKDVVSEFRSGDIVALVSKIKNLDVTHMGIIVIADDGLPHLMHASSSNGQVEISTLPLAEFMKRNRSLIGVRVFRLQE